MIIVKADGDWTMERDGREMPTSDMSLRDSKKSWYRTLFLMISSFYEFL
jgi:hypothetical protein